LGPQLVGICPEKVLKLTVNDYLKRALRSSGEKELPLNKEMLAGVLTGFVQVSITNPYEIVKIRLQMQTGETEKKGALRIVQDLGNSKDE